MRVAFLSAGLLEALLESDRPLGEALDAFLSDDTVQNGELIANEGTDSGDVISLEDILFGAIAAADASDIPSETTASVRARLSGELVTVRTLPEDVPVSGIQSPNANVEALNKVKAFISDLQLIVAAVEREKETADVQSFFDRVEDASTLLEDDVKEVKRTLGMTLDLLAEAYTASVQTPALATFIVSSGDSVTLQNNANGITMSVQDATVNGASVRLTLTVKDEFLPENFEVSQLETLFTTARDFGAMGGIELSGQIVRGDIELTIDSGTLTVENLDIVPVDFGTTGSNAHDTNVTASLDRIAVSIDGRLADTRTGGSSLEGLLTFEAEAIDMVREDETVEGRFIQLAFDHNIQDFVEEGFDVDFTFNRAPIEIGSSSFSFAGTVSDGLYDVDVTLMLDGENTKLAFEPIIDSEPYIDYRIQNNILTLTYTDFDPSLESLENVRDFVTHSQARQQIASLGLDPDIDHTYSRFILDGKTIRVSAFLRSANEPVFRSVFTSEHGTTYLFHQLSALDALDLDAPPTDAFLADPPYDDVAAFYQGLYGSDTDWDTRCRVQDGLSQLYMVEPFSFETSTGQIQAYLLDEDFDCNQNAARGAAAFFQTGATAKIPDGQTINATAYAAIRQDINGIDPTDPSTELAVYGPISIDQDRNVTTTFSTRLSFAGRQFETGQRGFDVWDDLTEPVTITNQDGVTFYAAEDADGDIFGTLTMDDKVFATLRETSSGTIFVDFIDDTFVSLL